MSMKKYTYTLYMLHFEVGITKYKLSCDTERPLVMFIKTSQHSPEIVNIFWSENTIPRINK